MSGYTIPVTPGNSDRNSWVECYFSLGLDYSEIRNFLLLEYMERLSVRQLMSLCSLCLCLCLCRRRPHSDIEEVIAVALVA